MRYNTLKATMLNKGNFESRYTPKICMHEDLVKNVIESIGELWDGKFDSVKTHLKTFLDTWLDEAAVAKALHELQEFCPSVKVPLQIKVGSVFLLKTESYRDVYARVIT